ncbi:Serine/threonine-protein kinase ulk3 [Geranomyces michiganensis]|nr:Serine/threonine-protein kinase ulk3 [Geranomyces michiganensis]
MSAKAIPNNNNDNPALAYAVLNPPIGRGSSGTVHRAYLKSDPLAIPHYAVKIIPRADLRRSKKQEQVVREISLLKRLAHPNVVKFVDVEWDASYVRVVMELCMLGSLSDYIPTRPGGRLNEVEAKGLLRQLAAGLLFLQSRNIAHRDIKSSNLLLTQTTDPPSSQSVPTLKIADFGIADDRHSAATATARTTMKGATPPHGVLTERIGTLLYMAPEVLKEDRYDSRCDLWSVGVVFYEMLVSKVPFQPVTSIDALLAQILSPTPPSLSLPPHIASRTSPQAQALVSALLTRNPAARLSFGALFMDPYLDLTHLPGPDSLARGMERIVQAVNIEEANGGAAAGNDIERLDHLVGLYADGIAHLLAYRDYLGPGHPATSELVDRIKAYIDRAEEVKALAQRWRRNTDGGGAGTGGAPPRPLLYESGAETSSSTATPAPPPSPPSPLSADMPQQCHQQHEREEQQHAAALRSLHTAANLAADSSIDSIAAAAASLPHFDRGLALLLASLQRNDADDEVANRDARLAEACAWMDAAETVRRRAKEGAEQKAKEFLNGAGSRTVVKKGALINVVYNR